MSNSTIKDDKADDTVHEAAGDDVAASDEAEAKRPLKSRLRPRNPWLLVAVVLAAALLTGGVLGYLKYDQMTRQLTDLRRAQADRDTVARLAKEYALKSLTYSFEDPDAFFRSVEDGVCQQLKDKYVNATDLLKGIMLQAQVSSTGEVLATDPVGQPGEAYQVVVSAHQTTRNLQNPTPKVSIILLQVTVNKAGNAWQVCDIGPKTGTRPPIVDQLPPAEPPAPAKPAPTR